MKLTQEQVWFFEHNGFIVLPYRLPEATVEKVKEVVLRDVAAAKEPIGYDADGKVHRLSNILDRDPIFWETATDPGILDGLESLIGPNIQVIRNRHNHVMLRTAAGGHVYMHRDAFNWTHSSVSIIIYLEETNLDNGCTEVVPGTNHLPYMEPPLEENEMVLQSGLLDQHVRVPLPAGGILAMNSMTFHSQGPNFTDGSRMSITLGYQGIHELSGIEDPKSTLIRGEDKYRGNDGKRTDGRISLKV